MNLIKGVTFSFYLVLASLILTSPAQAGRVEIDLDPNSNRPGLYAPEGGTAKAEKKGSVLRVDYDCKLTADKQDWLIVQLNIKPPIEEKDVLKRIKFKLKTSVKEANVNVRGGTEKTLTGFTLEKVTDKTAKEFDVDVAKVMKDKPEKKTWGGSPEIVYPIVVVTFSCRVEKDEGFIEISDLVLETK